MVYVTWYRKPPKYLFLPQFYILVPHLFILYFKEIFPLSAPKYNSRTFDYKWKQHTHSVGILECINGVTTYFNIGDIGSYIILIIIKYKYIGYGLPVILTICRFYDASSR